jgi:hypothetical protein
LRQLVLTAWNAFQEYPDCVDERRWKTAALSTRGLLSRTLGLLPLDGRSALVFFGAVARQGRAQNSRTVSTATQVLGLRRIWDPSKKKNGSFVDKGVLHFQSLPLSVRP